MRERVNVARRDLTQNGIGRSFAVVSAKKNIGERYFTNNLF